MGRFHRLKDGKLFPLKLFDINCLKGFITLDKPLFLRPTQGSGARPRPTHINSHRAGFPHLVRAGRRADPGGVFM
jgi:hypothetical protein